MPRPSLFKRRLLQALALSPWLGLARAQAPAAPASGARLRYGGDAAFAPFESLDASGRPLGFQIELLAALTEVTGLRFDIQLAPWPATEAAFRSGERDLVAMVDTPTRREWALFAHGHATPALAIYRPRGTPERQSLEALAGLRVAVLDGEAMRHTRATWLASLDARWLPQADAAAALQAVQQGRADLALLPRAYADALLAGGARPDIVAHHLSLPLQSYAFAVAPGRADLQRALQQGLDQLERSGRLEALRLRWLSSHKDLADHQRLREGLHTRQQQIAWVAAGGAGLAAVLGAGLVWRGRRVRAEVQRRREAEAALARAEQLLAHAFGQHPDAMLLVERASGLVRDANAALGALLGVAPAALIDRRLAALDAVVDAATLTQLGQLLVTQSSLQAMPLQVRRADGQLRDCLVSCELLDVGTEAQVFCLVRDVTEALARDAQLRSAYAALQADLAAERSRHASSRQDLDSTRGSLSQALDALAQAQGARAEAESRLHEFTRAVSHDLKTPINAVQGFAGLLTMRLRAGHVKEALGHAEQIQAAARRMSAMVDALAQLARVGRQPLQRSGVDMTGLVREAWSLLGPAMLGRQVELKLAVLPVAQADAGLVAQVWQNLLGNAVKYSAGTPQARVAVDSHRDARGTWYRVADNGAGFDMAQAGRLFQPFQRLHAGTQFEGTGVGLSLVRRIVELHGGEVRLRSAPGVGTVAEFTLDAPPAVTAAPGPGADTAPGPAVS